MLIHKGDERSEPFFSYFDVSINPEGAVDVTTGKEKNVFAKMRKRSTNASSDPGCAHVPLNRWAFVSVSVVFPNTSPENIYVSTRGGRKKSITMHPSKTNPTECYVILGVNGHCHIADVPLMQGPKTTSGGITVPAAHFVANWPLVLLHSRYEDGEERTVVQASTHAGRPRSLDV